jgi:hypothetical protein
VALVRSACAALEKDLVDQRVSGSIRRPNAEPTDATDEDLLTWQGRLCWLRRLSPPVLNLVDKRVRDRNEQAMNASATTLRPVARNQPGVN